MNIFYNAVNRLNATVLFKALAFMIVWVCLLNTQALAAPPMSGLDQDRELPVNVIADTLQYSDQHDVLTAKGEAVITQGTLSIKADLITINLVTKETEAQGKVLLTQNGDTIECESFTVNLDTQVGVVRQAKIFIKNENLHINGREVQKTGPNTYTVHDGTITTCDAKNPPWRIEASVIDVEVEGYAVARHPLLKVKGVPVMYLPAMVVPVKIERQSGFLPPEIGYSNRSGYEMDNSFFWAINDQSDATFWLDTATEQGVGTGAEYRIKLAEETDAKLYGYYANEMSSYQDDQYRNPLDRSNQRYFLNFEGQHYFDADTYMKADVSQISDRQFYFDYGDVVSRSKSDYSRDSTSNFDKQESTVFFNKNWEDSNLLVNTNWFENLRYNDPYTVQRLPEALYSTKLMPVKSTPLFYQVDAGYDNFWRDSGQKGQRVNLYPQLAMPMLMGGWLRFTPEVGLRGVQYLGLNETEGDETSALFPTVNAQLATTFVRIFDVDGQSLKKIRHTLEPGLEYEYVASDNQDEFPDAFDSPENYFTRHWAGYFIKNRFSSLFRDASGELSEHEMGYLKVGQAFNFSPPDRGLYYAGDRDATSTDVYTELSLDLNKHFYFKGDAYYDPYEQNLRRYSILGRLSGFGKNYLSAEYRYWRDLYQYLQFGTHFNVTSWLAMFVTTRYDFSYNQNFKTNIGMEYHSQCWGIRLWHETNGGNDDTRSDSSVKAMFFVKGFGDRSVF